ncbi:hypothetical protein Back11_56130 [Paenibacillus baekrokdamisoli]|uniref:Uncharacterized protein n=1 Tax=Paenibacillus baekrokdamisoli TaxID=1712516 RepID=A0A3G9JJJ6_9BACL|nr:hypothetical protein [Paenibacillus baekrokdamisoli]BBH24268.1 hypothetical protein Back11_56130 [Paenibacillus baekrokdamisoli]
MKYVNADIIFPEELLNEIQKYIHGGMVYVPKPQGLRKKWGGNSGSRQYLNLRNNEIRQNFPLVSLLINFQIISVFPAIVLKKSFIQKNRLFKVMLD